MHDTTHLPPPAADDRPVGGPAASAATERADAGRPGAGRLAHPIALFAAAAAIGAALATALGSAVGFGVMASSAASCSPSDGWCGLGAALAGLFLGMLAAALTYVAAGVITINRCRPRGQRAGHIAAHLAFPPAVATVLAILSAITESLT